MMPLPQTEFYKVVFSFAANIFGFQGGKNIIVALIIYFNVNKMRRNTLIDKTLNYVTSKEQIFRLLYYWKIKHLGLHMELALKRWVIRVYKSQMENGLRVGISTGNFPNLEFFTKAGARGCPETSVTNQPTLRSNPEER